MASNSGALLIPPSGQPQTNAAALDIRPSRDPVIIPSGWEWLWITLGILAAAALGWYLWRRWKQRPRPVSPALSIPPHRKAKDRLRAASELLSDPYAFCSLVSDVLRQYIEDRFSLKAPERTTEEFLEEMQRSNLLNLEQKSSLADFLSQCDLVKFARLEPNEQTLRALLEAAYRFIDETAPVGESASSLSSALEPKEGA